MYLDLIVIFICLLGRHLLLCHPYRSKVHFGVVEDLERGSSENLLLVHVNVHVDHSLHVLIFEH